jgi:uncharacterized protein (TIGR03067 family)
MSSTWIFRTDDLYLDSEVPQKRMRHFTVEIDPGTQPKAFHLTAESVTEKDGWLIFSREGNRLRIAFYDNFERRPKSFDSKDGLLILQLTPKEAPSGRRS